MNIFKYVFYLGKIFCIYLKIPQRYHNYLGNIFLVSISWGILWLHSKTIGIILCLRHWGLTTSCERSEIVPLEKTEDNYMMEKDLGPWDQDPGVQVWRTFSKKPEPEELNRAHHKDTGMGLSRTWSGGLLILKGPG